MTKALIVFLKSPIRGMVKTRLAKSIGEEAALVVYNQLVGTTYLVANEVNATKYAVFSDSLPDNSSKAVQHFRKFVQHGEDLGERMKNAFDLVFKDGSDKAVIIGSDCPELLPSEIEDAFHLLTANDLVIGPAQDGGYYLLGLKKTYSELFKIEEWSTQHVFHQTMKKAKQLNLLCAELPIKRDLDTVQDLNYFQGKGICKK